MKKFLFMSLLVLLISCGTLPRPASQSSTLLVIKGTAENTRELENYAMGYLLYFTGIEDPVSLTARNGYYLIDTLPAGKHTLVMVDIYATKAIKHIGLGEPDYHSIAFTLVPGKITIFPYSFDVSKYLSPKVENWVIQSYDFKELSKDDMEKIRLQLQKYVNIEYWEMSN